MIVYKTKNEIANLPSKSNLGLITKNKSINLILYLLKYQLYHFFIDL